MIEHYLSQLKSYLTKYLPQFGAQSRIPSVTIPPTPEINKHIILEILLQEYTKKCLETIKNNLETDYKNIRNAETKQSPHSAQHVKLVQKMNDITINLIKVRDAIDKTDTDSINALET